MELKNSIYMKNLKDNLTESLNESVLGITIGVVAGLLGYKLVSSVMKSLVNAGITNIFDIKLKKDAKLLEEIWIPRLEELLQAHPKSYEWIREYWNKDNVKDTLKRLNGTIGAITFVGDCISKDDWSEEDAKEFEKLWNKAFETNAKLWNKIVKDLTE